MILISYVYKDICLEETKQTTECLNVFLPSVYVSSITSVFASCLFLYIQYYYDCCYNGQDVSSVSKSALIFFCMQISIEYTLCIISKAPFV